MFATTLRQVAPGWRNTICWGRGCQWTRSVRHSRRSSFRLTTCALNPGRSWPLQPCSPHHSRPRTPSICSVRRVMFAAVPTSRSASRLTGSRNRLGDDFFIAITNNGLDGSNADPYANIVFTALGFNGIAPTSFTSNAAYIVFVVQSSTDINDLRDFKPGPWVGAEANNPATKEGCCSAKASRSCSPIRPLRRSQKLLSRSTPRQDRAVAPRSSSST